MGNIIWPIKKTWLPHFKLRGIEWGTLLKGANYHNTLFNPKTKVAAFALFVGIVRFYWGRETRNYDQVSFINTYANATFHLIALDDSKFIQECIFHIGVNIGETHVQT